MTKRMVYVVFGATGEYSDHREWPVLAFLKEADAEAHVVALETYVREHKVHDTAEGIMPDYNDREAIIKASTLDPNLQIDYTGTRYYTIEVELAK
jgi:hypothetical protein